VFVCYAVLVLLLLVGLIGWAAPAHGGSNMAVYVSICSLLGSFTVPSSKALGLVAEEVFFSSTSTNGDAGGSTRAQLLFLGLLGTLAACVAAQFLYINKALERFGCGTFEAIYYVAFTCCALLATALLFQEWRGLRPVDGLALLCALGTVSVGVVLLRVSSEAVLTWRQGEGRQKED